MRRWVDPKVRDDVVAVVEVSARRAEWSVSRVLDLVGVRRDRFYDWLRRRGRPNRLCTSMRRP